MRILIIFILSSFISFCQGQQVSDTIQISYLYNVTVLFDTQIKDDPYFGSGNIVKYEKLDDYTLMIKANGAEMQRRGVSKIPNSNMTVKTEKGIYNFILTYKKVPSRTFISSDKFKPIHLYRLSQVEPKPINAKRNVVKKHTNITELLDKLSKKKQTTFNLGKIDSRNKTSVIITNVWVDDKYCYFKLMIENNSAIPYDIEYSRFFKSYGHWSIKQSTKPIEDVTPRFSLVNDENITIHEDKAYINVLVFNKFTLNKGEFFNIQVGETNGARQLLVPVDRKSLIKAINIQHLQNQ